MTGTCATNNSPARACPVSTGLETLEWDPAPWTGLKGCFLWPCPSWRQPGDPGAGWWPGGVCGGRRGRAAVWTDHWDSDQSCHWRGTTDAGTGHTASPGTSFYLSRISICVQCQVWEMLAVICRYIVSMDGDSSCNAASPKDMVIAGSLPAPLTVPAYMPVPCQATMLCQCRWTTHCRMQLTQSRLHLQTLSPAMEWWPQLWQQLPPLLSLSLQPCVSAGQCGAPDLAMCCVWSSLRCRQRRSCWRLSRFTPCSSCSLERAC